MSRPLVAFLLTLRSDIRYRTGRLDAARRDAEQAVELCARGPDAHVLTAALFQAAKVDAVQGRSADCVARLDRATEIAAAGPDLTALAHLAATHGLLRLGQGAWDDAVRHLERAEALQADHGPADPLVVGSSPRLIEAYVACGRHDDARRELGRLATAVRSDPSPAARAAVLRAEALTAADADLDRRFPAA
ncbi:MAG: hypothetical protein AVDCRST_MAG79-966, partial [uncultured Thermoleophilia bacterium]